MEVELSSVVSNDSTEGASKSSYRVYNRRWVTLAIYFACNFCNCMQWMQYSIISDVVSRYYSASIWAVDALSFMIMVPSTVLLLPISYIMDKKGLKWTILTGILLTAIGSWIKVVSVRPDLLYVGFIAQGTIAVASVFLYASPPRLAAIWFGPNQVSTATSIGVTSAQAGIGMGLLIPPYAVHNSDDLNIIGHQLQMMFIIYAVIATACLLLVVFLFQSEPATPPSAAQDAARIFRNEKQKNKNSVKKFLTNRSFVLLLLSYAIVNSSNNVTGTYLSQIVLEKFPGHEEDAGELGNLFNYSGILGSFLIGIWLDKTHIYKESGIFIYAVICTTTLGIMFSLIFRSLPAIYISFAVSGIFNGSYMSFGYEQGLELTYPESEGVMSGLMNTLTCLLTLVMAIVGALLFTYYKSFGFISFTCCLLATGLALSTLIRDERKRFDAAPNK